MRRGVGEAGVDVEVEVELEGDIVRVMVGGELSGGDGTWRRGI